MKISKQKEESRKFRNHSKIFAHVAKIEIFATKRNLVRMSPAQCFYFILFLFILLLLKKLELLFIFIFIITLFYKKILFL